jgi:DNA helicase HerA-like ATPase
MGAWVWSRRTKRDLAMAKARENASMARATVRDPVDPRFRADMECLAQQGGAIKIGTSALDPALAVFLNLRDLLGAGHGLVLGRTGTGKTRLVLGIIRELLRLFVRCHRRLRASSRRTSKGDLVTLIHDLIAELVHQLPPQQANRLLDALVVIDPFADGGLVPLNVLARDPGSPVFLRKCRRTRWHRCSSG